MFPDPASRPARQIMQAQLDEGALLQADVVALLPEAASTPKVVEPVETTGPREGLVSTGSTSLSPELRALLEATPVSTLSSALRKRGYTDSFVEGVATNQPRVRMVGQARTLRLIPYRPDLFKSHGGGFNAQKQAFDGVGPGEVLVVDARGIRETGTVGDILALRAQVRGAAGIVTDGSVRDYAAVQELGLPVFSQGAHPSVLGRRHVPWETDVTVACGGATATGGATAGCGCRATGGVASCGAGGAPNGAGGAPKGAGGAPNGAGSAPNGAGDAPNGAGSAPNGAGGMPAGVGGALNTC